jgi:hypothetical protein
VAPATVQRARRQGLEGLRVGLNLPPETGLNIEINSAASKLLDWAQETAQSNGKAAKQKQ